MRARVIYESMFGNTAAIAQAIAAGLRRYGEVDVMEVGVAPPGVPAGVDLLVVGGPTHAFTMSRPDSRKSAAPRVDKLVSQGVGIREWIDTLGGPGAVRVATFDTRLAKPRWFWGSAARAAQRRLRRLGFTVASRAQNFYVRGPGGAVTDALLAGELERAEAWGGALAEVMEGDKSGGRRAAALGATAALTGVVLGLALLASACLGVRGSGVIVSETREVAAFTRASFGGGLEVTVDKGALSPLVLTGDDNLLPFIRSEVVHGRLVVEPDTVEHLDPTHRITAAITVPLLEAFAASGATSATVAEMAASRAELEASGASSLHVETLIATAVDITASGASDVTARGTATTTLDAEASGASSLHLQALPCDRAWVDASGASYISVNVRHSVEGECSGASNIDVLGGPSVHDIEVSGASSVDFY